MTPGVVRRTLAKDGILEYMANHPIPNTLLGEDECVNMRWVFAIHSVADKLDENIGFVAHVCDLEFSTDLVKSKFI